MMIVVTLNSSPSYYLCPTKKEPCWVSRLLIKGARNLDSFHHISTNDRPIVLTDLWRLCKKRKKVGECSSFGALWMCVSRLIDCKSKEKSRNSICMFAVYRAIPPAKMPLVMIRCQMKQKMPRCRLNNSILCSPYLLFEDEKQKIDTHTISSFVKGEQSEDPRRYRCVCHKANPARRLHLSSSMLITHRHTRWLTPKLFRSLFPVQLFLLLLLFSFFLLLLSSALMTAISARG